MDIYRRLGVPKRVNGAGLLTRLGGSLMDAEVLDAMREAATAFVDMAELQSRASGVSIRCSISFSSYGSCKGCLAAPSPSLCRRGP